MRESLLPRWELQLDIGHDEESMLSGRPSMQIHQGKQANATLTITRDGEDVFVMRAGQPLSWDNPLIEWKAVDGKHPLEILINAANNPGPAELDEWMKESNYRGAWFALCQQRDGLGREVERLRAELNKRPPTDAPEWLAEALAEHARTYQPPAVDLLNGGVTYGLPVTGAPASSSHKDGVYKWGLARRVHRRWWLARQAIRRWWLV